MCCCVKMCLLRSCIIMLLAFSASQSSLENDTDFNKKLKNLFKPSHQPPHKRQYMLSIIKGGSGETHKTSRNVIEYVERIKDRGVHVLKNMENLIMKKLNVKEIIVDNSPVIDTYIQTVQEYYNKTVGTESDMVYGEDIILYDTADIACRLLCQKQIALLNRTLSAYNSTKKRLPKNFIENISQEVIRAAIEHSTHIKTEEIRYICDKYKACKMYPAVTDHFAYFLNEILQLPKSKFEILLKVTTMALSHNEYFIELVTNIKKDKDAITEVLTAVAKTTNMKEFVEDCQKALSIKFDIIHSQNEGDKIKAASLRILLDLIDKLYEKEKNKQLLVQIEKMIKSIKGWAKGKISSISVVTADFINDVLKAFFQVLYFKEDTTKSMYELMEILVGENTILHEDYYKSILAQRYEL